MNLFNKSRIAIAVQVCSIIVLGGCMARSSEFIEEDPLTVPAVYTRYLTYPVPSKSIDAEFNPPVLRWPIEKNAATYDVRMSKDSLFKSGEVIGASDISWAMFNAHRKLDKGEWYWQYRSRDGEWSGVQSFVITDEAHALVSPPAAEFLRKIGAQHPRVLASIGQLPGLRKLSHDEDAQAIIAQAENALRAKILTERDGRPLRQEIDPERNRKLHQDASKRLGDFAFGTVEPLCQAFILTGEERYSRRAIHIALEVARWDPSGVTGSDMSDFSDARCMLSMALVLDTFWDDLTATQRQVLIKATHKRAKGFYDSWINNQEARVLSGHVWQHILHYFFQTALALYGEDESADEWLAYAYELFLARTPILGGTDGGWTEGASYFRMNMETVVEIPLIIKQYSGFDFINAHPWYHKNVAWLVYHVPPGSSADGFGDNTEEVFSPGPDYRAYAAEIARLTGSSLASWYAAKCKEYENIRLADHRILRWVRLARTRHLDMPTPKLDSTLATARLFRDIGLVSMHSNPEKTSENLMVAMRSGPFGCYGHFLSDHNAFNILYGGERTFFRTGYKVTMKDPHRTGWYQHTKSNNSVLVNGQGQPYSTEAFGWIPSFVQGSEIAYAMGDASNAYSSNETGEDHRVKKFYRHLVLLKPDIILVYDELEAHDDVEWSWLIHSMNAIRLKREENSFESTFDNAMGIGKLWASQPVVWALADTFDVPAVNWRKSRDRSGNLKVYEDEQWHLKATNKTKASSMRFLAVLQISPEAGVRQIDEVEGEGHTLIRAGSWRIQAQLDTGASPELIIRHEEGTSMFTYMENDLPRIHENFGGRRKEIIAKKVMPWHLRQSVLQHYQ